MGGDSGRQQEVAFMTYDAVAFLESLFQESTSEESAWSLDPGPDILSDNLSAEWHLEWDCRAAIMEFDGGLPRERAEAAALADILDQMRRADINPGNCTCR
jgi:hypothetical protein